MCKFLDFMDSPSYTYMKWPLGHLSITRILLNHGADPNVTNTLGMNVNDVAQDNIKIILKDVIEIKNKEETTDTQEQFLEACKYGEIEVIKEMFKNHSNLGNMHKLHKKI